MKKILIIGSIVFVLVSLFTTSFLTIRNTHRSDEGAQPVSNNSNPLIYEPERELYQKLFSTILYPHIQKSIDGYYDKYFYSTPREDPWSYKFSSIQRYEGTNFTYLIRLEISPYVGPHLSVGRDRIIFKIDLNGVKLEKFEHLESYGLPPNYQNIIKNKWPTD